MVNLSAQYEMIFLQTIKHPIFELFKFTPYTYLY